MKVSKCHERVFSRVRDFSKTLNIRVLVAPVMAIFLIAFTANLPVPLFPIYSVHYGLSDFDLSVFFSIYGMVVLLALLLAPSFTNKLGLENIVVISLLVSLVSAILFMLADGAAVLYLARYLSGAAVGLFMGAGNALLLQRLPDHPKVGIGCANLSTILGFGLSPLLTGIWAHLSADTAIQGPFAFFISLLVLTICIHVFTSTTGAFKVSSRPLLIRIKISFPIYQRANFIKFVCPSIFLMFSLNGIFIALIPSYIKKVMHSESLYISGFSIFVLMVGGAIAQHFASFKENYQTTLVGVLALASGSCLLVISGETGSFVLLFISVILQSFGSGWTFQGAFALAAEMALKGDKVGILSTFYIFGYLGTITMPMLTGFLTGFYNLVTAMAIVYAFEFLLVIWVVFNYPRK